MLVEAGDWQPLSLAGAFQDPLPLDARDGKSLRLRAVERIVAEIASADEAYGMSLARRYLSLDDVTLPAAQKLSLPKLGEWVESTVQRGSIDV